MPKIAESQARRGAMYNPGKERRMLSKSSRGQEPIWAGKRACSVELAALPPMLLEIFERLEAAGARAACLFGGAARDADLEALWGQPRPIKDYDLRCWIAPSTMRQKTWEADFGLALMRAFEGSSMEMAKSAGTGRLRHVLRWRCLELDVSARPRPEGQATSSDCARERALDADASLSAVAVDSDLRGWCEALYAADRAARRLSYYPGVDPARLAAYRERLRAKFPDIPERHMASPAPDASAGGAR